MGQAVGHVEWVHGAYRQLRRAVALAPKAIAFVCHVALAVLLADLVWIGLVNGGVRSAVPGMVRAEALARLEEGMSASDVALVEASFTAPNASGVRRFCGSPSQLGPLSRLSRLFARSASVEGAGLLAGVARVHKEYEALGIPKAALRSSYLAHALHELASCLTVLLVARNWRFVMRCLNHFVTSCLR